MRALLDTSVLLGPDPGPIDGEIAISAISLAELHFGVLVASVDSVRAERLRRVALIERNFDALPVDEAVAREYGHPGRPGCRRRAPTSGQGRRPPCRRHGTSTQRGAVDSQSRRLPRLGGPPGGAPAAGLSRGAVQRLPIRQLPTRSSST